MLKKKATCATVKSRLEKGLVGFLSGCGLIVLIGTWVMLHCLTCQSVLVCTWKSHQFDSIKTSSCVISLLLKLCRANVPGKSVLKLYLEYSFELPFQHAETAATPQITITTVLIAVWPSLRPYHLRLSIQATN